MTKLKEVTLSNDDELINLIGLSPISLKIIVFEKVSWIYRLYKNKVIFKIA